MPLALLVETDPALSALMQVALARAGFEVRACEKSGVGAPRTRRARSDIERRATLDPERTRCARSRRAAAVRAARALPPCTRAHSLRFSRRTSRRPLHCLHFRELDIAAVLEKPFPLEQLERVALRLRLSMSFTLFPDE